MEDLAKEALKKFKSLQ